MKKYLAIALLFTLTINAQWIKIPDKEYTTLTFGVDPYASYKEKGLDFIGEFTLISHFGYVKIGTQIFPELTGDYFDITGGAGFNQESTIFSIETRLYQGIRAGHNWRGKSESYEAYNGPLFGVDLGVDFKISNNFLLGMRITDDWREDMKYSGANPCWEQSGFLTTTFTFN